MNILYFLVGCSLVMALIFLAAFVWSLKNGQHDDVHTPGIRILFDDEVELPTTKTDKDHFSE